MVVMVAVTTQRDVGSGCLSSLLRYGPGGADSVDAVSSRTA